MTKEELVKAFEASAKKENHLLHVFSFARHPTQDRYLEVATELAWLAYEAAHVAAENANELVKLSLIESNRRATQARIVSDQYATALNVLDAAEKEVERLKAKVEAIYADQNNDAEIHQSLVSKVIELEHKNAELTMKFMAAQNYEASAKEWFNKTEWLQKENFPAKYLGMHRADVLKDVIDELRKLSHPSIFIKVGTQYLHEDGRWYDDDGLFSNRQENEKIRHLYVKDLKSNGNELNLVEVGEVRHFAQPYPNLDPAHVEVFFNGKPPAHGIKVYAKIQEAKQ